MFLHRCFRLLGYLTLALSCAALIFAEAPFLPDLQFCLLPLLALLLVAWWVEGRWSLPVWGANLLGLLIAGGGASWLVTQLTDDESLLARVPLHLALLPYMGPLVMAALLVKLFRPRESGAFWTLQGLGLMQIALGCILEGDPLFGTLLAAYFVGALACLALRYRLSTVGECPRVSSWWLFFFLLRWTPAIALPALLFFLLTPRGDSASWEPLNQMRGSYRRITSDGGGAEINLNHTGRIERNDEIALRVAVVDAAGQPSAQLPDEQHWRGIVLDWYENGKWTATHLLPPFRRRGQTELPDFGPGQLFLTFTVAPRQPGALALAEPIQFGPPSARYPVVTLSGEDHRRLFGEMLGTLLPLQVASRHEYRYRQVIPTGGDPARTTAEGVRSGEYREHLTHLPARIAPQVQSWTLDLLRRLSSQRRYRLPARVRAALTKPAASFLLDPDDSEAVAHVLSDYLAFSGDFTYSLDLVRQNPTLDPALDFLFNVKRGHCERYATALALMLRSVGIPARLVKGYRGHDTQGDGLYLVRHRHAHAWVEILVPNGSSRPPTFDWLTLDPTPADSSISQPPFSLSLLWEDIQRSCLEWWRARIVGYNADEQADLWDNLKSEGRLALLLKLTIAVIVFIAAGCVMFLLSRRLRRSDLAGIDEETTFYARFVRIVERHASLRPAYGQTPREYGATVRAFLQTRPAWEGLRELPARVVDLFYRVRFGRQPLSEGEQTALQLELDRFAATLQSSRHVL
jgi:transglutaminase-like putative cysteine protease